jgi:hypothetical protein
LLSIIAHSLCIFHKMGNKPPSVLAKGHHFLSFITHSEVGREGGGGSERASE